MPQPPVDPTGREPLADVSPTEPVPAFQAPAFYATTPSTSQPAQQAAVAAAGAPPAPPSPTAPASIPPGLAFAPVEPEPGPGVAYTMPVSAAVPSTRAASGSSRVLNLALGAAILVGAVGIAFAVGRASSPASTAGSAPVAGQLPNGNSNGNAGGNGNANGNANGNRAGLPNPSFDLNGNNGRPGDIDGGLGLERGGFLRGGGFTGTVTAVTSDSITIKTDQGPTVTFGLDGTTTYHQQAPATQSDVKTGSTVQVQPGGRIQPTQDANGNLNLGTAGNVTIVP